MENFENFYKIFSTNNTQFWKTIFKDTLCPIKEKVEKVSLLCNLYLSIINKTYYPDKPRDYIIFNKGEYVSRVVPIFAPRDVCVYFYCIKKLEDNIAVNRAPDTYGGWKLGGNIRAQEREEAQFYKENIRQYETPDGNSITLDISEEYPMESSFNPAAWKAEWGEFTGQVYLHSCKASEHNYVLEMDIANFYDAIRLDILENKIRGVCPPEKNDEVSLLFHFLKFWNRDYNFYSQQSVGIPQDEVSDCSRILANFYLQDYDHSMLNICKQYGAKYMRYADDQIVFTKSEEDSQKITYLASLSLMQYGLCLNQKKVKLMNKKYFEEYMAFEWFILLAKKRTQDVDNAIDYLLENKTKLKNNGATLTKRLLSLVTIKNNKYKVKKLFYEFLKPEFLQSQNLAVWHLEKIYNMLNNQEKNNFLKFLDEQSNKLIHNHFHYTLLKFYKNIKFNRNHIEKRVEYLKENFYPKKYSIYK